MKKILFSAKNFYPFFGGAEISMYNLLRRLTEENEIHVVCQGKKNEDIKKDGIYIHRRKATINIPRFKQVQIFLENKRWIKILNDFMKENEPEIILTQLEFAPSTIDIAKKYNIPSFLFIRDYFHFCPIGFVNGINCNKKCCFCIPKVNTRLYNFLKYGQDISQYIFTMKMLKWSRRAVKNANIVIANSAFLSNLTKKWFNVDTEFIYPFIDLKSIKSKEYKREYITFIKPDILKGAKIFIDIAKRLKDKKFLCVGKLPSFFEYKKDFLSLKNVKYIEWSNNMAEIYSQTKILLAPSIWPEPFGRVCVEAMVNGIPCIVSNRGGLPEVIGDAGITINNIFNIKSWTKAINILNENRQLYQAFSKKSKQRAKKFDFEKQYKKFKSILNPFTS